MQVWFDNNTFQIAKDNDKIMSQAMPKGVYLMNAACWGRMKTKRQTPTSCSEASSTYL